MFSAARIILFEAEQRIRTIVLESPLPAVPRHTIIDATEWRIDASGVDVGLELGDSAELWGLTIFGADDAAILLSGDETRVSKATVRDSRIGIKVAGANARVDGVTVSDSSSHGIEVAVAGSASISASTIERNRGSGVSIDRAAGDVLIGPDGDPPTPNSGERDMAANRPDRVGCD